MIVSCGIDIVSNGRIEKLLDREGERFVYKVFPEGVPDCLKRKDRVGCVAARFALKEAVIKAFSSVGIDILLKDVKIHGSGKDLNVRVSAFREYKILFSISHERDYSVAMVNLLKIEEEKIDE